MERIDFSPAGLRKDLAGHAARAGLYVFGGRADQPRRRPVSGKLGAHPRKRAPLADLPRADRADHPWVGASALGRRHRHGRPWSGEEARMSQRRPVIAAWAVRMARGLWPDRNPLRRTVDRVEAVVVAGLAAAFMAGAPLAALAAGHYAAVTPPTPLRSGPPGTRCPRRCSLPSRFRLQGSGDRAGQLDRPRGRRRTGMVPVTRPRPRRYQQLEGRLQPPTPPQHARRPAPAAYAAGCTYR